MQKSTLSGGTIKPVKEEIFHLQKARDAEHVIGAFRAWAGYKDYGTADATKRVAHYQHVLSFGSTKESGPTGIHAHLAHAHIVIPVSGRALFSYDGVTTEAIPGTVIVQHGGTVHDQYDYSYAPSSKSENAKTLLSLVPVAHPEKQSFSFLELFVPQRFANVEIVPPEKVTAKDRRTAWDHDYHAADARFGIQTAADPGAVYRPIRGRTDLEARDTNTWEASGKLVAVWFIRPVAKGGLNLTKTAAPINVYIPGARGGVNILHMVKGSASFLRANGKVVTLEAGDVVTYSGNGIASRPFKYSDDMQLIKMFVANRAKSLKNQTPAEIARLEALGPKLITNSEVRPAGDTRPVNFLREARLAAQQHG